MQKKSLVLYCIIGLIIVTIYGPFILKGGFGISDELTNIYERSENFFTQLSSNYSQTSSVSRPVSVFIGSITIVLFEDISSLYIFFRVSLWIISVVILFYTVKDILGEKEGWIFIFFSFSPIFASAFIASALTNYILPVFFWALHLLFLVKYCSYGKLVYYCIGYLFLILGILSSEILLPLLVLSSFLPILYSINGRRLPSRSNIYLLIIKFVLPVIVISISFYFFKFYITKGFQTGVDTYGFETITVKSFMQALYFFFSISVGLFLQLIAIIPNLFEWRIFILFVLITLFFIQLMKNVQYDLNKNKIQSNEKKGKYFIFLSIITLSVCTSVFFLSSYPAQTFGHYNKMMTPAIVPLCLLLSISAGKLLRRNWLPLVIGFSLIWQSSMLFQIDNFIESWRIRKEVFIDCVLKLEETNLGNKPHLIANVPFFTQRNYNNEHVFWLSWDFFSGLKFFGSEKLSSAFPFCWQTLVNPDYYSGHNINHHLTVLSEDTNLWYYEYDLQSGISTLKKVYSRSLLEEEFQRIVKNKVNYHPIILRQRIRMKLKDLVLRRIQI